MINFTWRANFWYSTEKKFSINFSKAKTKLGLSFHYNGDNSYLFVNGKKIYKFSVNYSSTDKSNILHIYKYLMIKYNIQNVWIY